MKITRKLYQEIHTERGQLKKDIRRAEDEERFDDWRELKAKLPALEELFEKLPKVFVAYNIGCRGYYEEVVKIGKTYFDYGRAMTKGRGYYGINEIAEITPQINELK